MLVLKRQSLHKYNQLSSHKLVQAKSLAYFLALQAPIYLRYS